MYSPRARTSGIGGNLYETKLLSLLYFRAIHDERIAEFELASNVDKIGVFDDICFKVKIEGFDKPIAVFIQAQHRENKEQAVKIDLATYFNSYMKIRQLSHPSNNELFFRGIFDETECLFVVYTNAKVGLCDDSIESDYSAKLNNLIGTGGTVKQPFKNEETVEYLTKKAVSDQITSLAERMVRFIYDERNFQMLLSDYLVIRYHVILAQKVFDVSEIQPPQSKDGPWHRIASFRQDFFDNNEECITLLKNALYLEIIKKVKPQLLTHKQLIKNEAVELAAKEILFSLHFKVPVAFGNKDLTMTGSDDKIEKIINYITSRIHELLYNCKHGKIVTIDESLAHVFLEIDGGIAGAIGNIFVLDEDTKLMKITDNWELLGTLAKRLYTKLNSEILNLHEYKFCIIVDRFPILSFECSEHEENLARDFLNKLLIYCNQADETGVEETLKVEIENYQHNQPNYFQVKTDAIVTKYHAVIQKWCTHPQEWSLTRERDLFQHSINNIIKDPLMCSINLTYMNKLQQYNYTFTEESVRSLNLQDQLSSTVIVAENSELTVIKVMQHLKNKDNVVLDLEYIANLPTNDRNAIRTELTNTNIEKVLILVSLKIDSKNEMNTLADIAKAVRNKSTIIVTNQTSLQIINRYFPEADIIHDKKLSLTDMSKESQKSIYEAATAIFPGVEISLERFLRGWPKTESKSQSLPSPVGETSRSSARDGLAVPAVELTTCSNKIFQQYPKRFGIRGQLYETKLLSLIYFRAVHDDRIEEFHLATNVDKIGSFDDICFRAKVTGIDKPLSVFIITKHRENRNSVLTVNNTDLVKYFHSYLKIKDKFNPNNKDVLFNGTFSETECLFVIYTTAKRDFSNTYKGNFAEHLNALIGTGDPGSWPSLDLNQENLYKLVLDEQITAVARTMAKCIFGEFNDIQRMMENENILKFHVILAQKVFNVSEEQSSGHRVARFKQSFFDNDDKYLRFFKQELCTEVLKRQTPDSTIEKHGIFSIMVHDEEQKGKEANHMIIECLPSFEFKVPASFGNSDLTIKGSDKRIEMKLKHLTSRIVELIEQSKPSNIVTIDESTGKGFLQLSGGIASAVGNLLVLDDESNLMKFNENYESLGKLAKKLFDKLNGEIDDLNKYKFDVQVNLIPKLSFATDKYTKKITSDFLNRLLFYTSQSNEKEVEKTLIYEIMDDQGDDIENVEITSDAIFLKYHDEIQKWSMASDAGKGTYLKKEGSLYKNAVKHTTRQPLISAINMMERIKNNNYTFRQDAVNSIKFNDLLSGTVVVTENKTLTVAKFTNDLNNKNCIVLDLAYILNLSARDHNTLRRGLTDTNEVKTAIVVFDKELIAKYSSKKIENIANSVKDKIVIIITDQKSVEIAKKYFSLTGNVIKDEIKLIDMSDESQKHILKNTKVIFQGNEVSLGEILINDTIGYIKGDVLNKIMHSNKNIIGKPINSSNYNPKLYIERTVRCIELKTPENIDVLLRQHSNRRRLHGRRRIDKGRKNIRTLNDLLNDDVVLIIGDPGVGKSTLLTHLSLETVELCSKFRWILRINLLKYSQQFSEWKKNKTDIDTMESLKFLCKIALSEESSKTNNLDITLEESNGAVYLKDCTGDEWTAFELKMFLSYYSNQEIIILLDGFDEICPYYVNEVLALIKAVKNFPRTHKMCITSRSYGKMNTILELQCVTIYEIDPLSMSQQASYLNNFWEEKKILKELNDDQYKNICEFITSVSHSVDLKELIKKSDLLTESKKEIPFLMVYFSLIHYLKINLTLAPSSVTNTLNELYDDWCHNAIFQNPCDAIPLHLNIIADYLYNKIKEINIKPINWDLNTDIFHIYEDFMVPILFRISFQKSQIDMSNPQMRLLYEREYAGFKDDHKKLAAYAVFGDCLFNENESKEIEEMIYKLKEGEERTGIVCDVVDDVPIFVHSSFAEYFAVEYICDLLRSNENQKFIWDFMLNVMFFNCNLNVLTTLDAKIKIDKELPTLFEKHNILIFDLLLKQGKTTGNKQAEIKSSLSEAIRNELRTIGLLLLSTIEDNLDESNLMDFIKIVKDTNMFLIAVKMGFEEFIASIVNHVKVIDESKLMLLFEDFDLNENVEKISADELVQKLHSYVWTRMDIVPDWENLAELSGQIYFI